MRMFHFISISWNAVDVPVWYMNRLNSNPKFAAEVRWPSPFLCRWCHHTLSSQNAWVKAGNNCAALPKYRLAYCSWRCSTGRIRRKNMSEWRTCRSKTWVALSSTGWLLVEKNWLLWSCRWLDAGLKKLEKWITVIGIFGGFRIGTTHWGSNICLSVSQTGLIYSLSRDRCFFFFWNVCLRNTRTRWTLLVLHFNCN